MSVKEKKSSTNDAYQLLSDVCKYGNDRIYIDEVNMTNYISTENMVPNRGGIVEASSIPDVKTMLGFKQENILLSNIRPYFKKIWFANKYGGCSNDVLVLEVNKDFNAKFLYYVLSDNNFFNYSTLTSKGTKMPRGTKSAIMKYLVPKVNATIQQHIASILSSYDDLIEENNHKITILQEQAQEIYKEWFVRFRFPGYRTTKFEKGFPRCWKQMQIKDIAKVKSGYAFKSECWQAEGIPVVKIKDIQNGTINMTDLSYVSDENANQAKKFFLTKGDLLIAMTGATIGKIALIPKVGKMTVNQRVGKFFLGSEPLKKVPYLFCLFSQNYIQEQIISIAGSNAAQPNISAFDIEKIKILCDRDIISAFNNCALPLFEVILNLQEENEKLISQRDLLLPRLMSGKLEVH